MSGRADASALLFIQSDGRIDSTVRKIDEKFFDLVCMLYNGVKQQAGMRLKIHVHCRKNCEKSTKDMLTKSLSVSISFFHFLFSQ